MLNYKEYIYAIYQEHSFSKAAQKLFVSQPWLSSVVKKVEQEIKTPLFDRSTNPISLTPAGEYYIQQVEKVMAIEEDMREHFAALSGHGAALAETARVTERRMELDEDTKTEPDRRQAVRRGRPQR